MSSSLLIPLLKQQFYALTQLFNGQKLSIHALQGEVFSLRQELLEVRQLCAQVVGLQQVSFLFLRVFPLLIPILFVGGRRLLPLLRSCK